MMKKFLEQFGGKATPRYLAQYEKSPNWREGKFQNLEETTMNIQFKDVPDLLYKQVFDKENRAPKEPIPIIPFDHNLFTESSEHAKLIWYGHSVVFMHILGKNLLIDPMLGENASPIAPFATKRFSEGSLQLIDDFPAIDLILLTHDHYDHLDLASISKLKSKTKHFFVAIGVKRHLIAWGIAPEKITEFDWWQSHNFEGIQITFTPTRHFSGRGLSDRAKSFWGGWVFKTATENIYFSGDGGYGKHFQEVGEKLGPFDLGIMECGQYNERWHLIHLFPEESIQAAKDAGVKKVMPVHWAGFALALHNWVDPAKRFVSEATKKQIPFITPKLGEVFTSKSNSDALWWEKYF